ncbi:MAG: diguanylate cyclase [Pseudomonadales bacterium]
MNSNNGHAITAATITANIMHDLSVSDLMTRGVKHVDSQASLKEVVSLMGEHNISCQLIIEEGRPVGIITERDMAGLLLEVASKRATLDSKASDYMSTPLISIQEQDSLYDAILVSNTHNIRHLPVVNETGQVQGLITQSDIAEAHFQVAERQAELIERSVLEQTSDLEKENKGLRALSREDPLMKIGNRGAMELDLASTHAQAKRYGRQYCAALLDVDFFKQYNDYYGHSAGDEVLRTIARILRNSMRSTDRIYRYGGEEILVILYDADVNGAYKYMHRAITAVAEFGIPHCESPFGVLTGTAGVASAIENGQCRHTWQEVVMAADKAMYDAKKASRNAVCIAA